MGRGLVSALLFVGGAMLTVCSWLLIITEYRGTFYVLWNHNSQQTGSDVRGVLCNMKEARLQCGFIVHRLPV